MPLDIAGAVTDVEHRAKAVTKKIFLKLNFLMANQRSEEMLDHGRLHQHRPGLVVDFDKVL